MSAEYVLLFLLAYAGARMAVSAYLILTEENDEL